MTDHRSNNTNKQQNKNVIENEQENIDLLANASSDPDTQNLVKDISRFRENPAKFLATLGRHLFGSSWRAYDDYVGQPLYYRGLSEDIAEKTMKHQAIQSRITTLVELRMEQERDWTLTDAQRQAKRKQYHEWISSNAEYLVQNLICTFDHKSVLQMMYYVIANVFARTYHQGVHVIASEIKRLKKIAKELERKKQSLIFLPCHKSHIDYIAIQFICFRFGISLPVVVAGDNLNFAIIGPMLQQVGAMFIRRGSWGEDYLYPGVAQAYMETLFQNGYNFQCFVEGTRSRTGKLLPPKFGILKYILDSILSGAVEDSYILPVSTQYDKVPEAETYAIELLGKEKKSESFMSFLDARKMLSLKMGRVDVRFDEPWSLRAYVVDQLQVLRHKANVVMPLELKNTARLNSGQAIPPIVIPEDLHKRLLRSFGYRVLADINKVSEVMPTALVGTVMLTWVGRGISKSEMMRRVQWLIGKIHETGGNMSIPYGYNVEPLVDNALKVLGPDLVETVTEKGSLLESVYIPKDPFKLSYYRNQVIHLFVDQAIASLSIFTQLRFAPTLRIHKQLLADHASFLSDLLSGEFVFSQLGLTKTLENVLQQLQEQGVLEPSANDDFIQLSHKEFNTGYENFDFYCYLLWPFIDGYWTASVSLFMLTEPTPERIFYKRAQALAKTLYHESEVTYYEAVNKELLKDAFMHFEAKGLIKKTTVKLDPMDFGPKPKVTVYFELTPDWQPQRKDGVFVLEGKLYDYSERIARSRNKPLRPGLTQALNPRILGLCSRVGTATSETARL